MVFGQRKEKRTDWMEIIQFHACKRERKKKHAGEGIKKGGTFLTKKKSIWTSGNQKKILSNPQGKEEKGNLGGKRGKRKPIIARRQKRRGANRSNAERVQGGGKETESLTSSTGEGASGGPTSLQRRGGGCKTVLFLAIKKKGVGGGHFSEDLVFSPLSPIRPGGKGQCPKRGKRSTQSGPFQD